MGHWVFCVELEGSRKARFRLGPPAQRSKSCSEFHKRGRSARRASDEVAADPHQFVVPFQKPIRGGDALNRVRAAWIDLQNQFEILDGRFELEKPYLTPPQLDPCFLEVSGFAKGGFERL